MDRKLMQQITQMLADGGKPLETGWRVYNNIVVSPNASDVQREVMRETFYAGAHYIFDFMLNMMSDGDDPTPADEARMRTLHDEFRAYIADFNRKRGIGGKPN